MTGDVQRWLRTLGPELRTTVRAAMGRVAAGGPALGRPRVGHIRGSSVHKLKEVRVGRGIRILFAFDSNQDAVMLVGGDKTGNWNRWYGPQIKRAEELYRQHERSIGKCLSQPAAGRTSSPRSR
jgi:hypothetical protein